jgi:hypothetical protein
MIRDWLLVTPQTVQMMPCGTVIVMMSLGIRVEVFGT